MDALRNRKKPTLGAIIGAAAYFVLVEVFDVDQELAFTISGAIAVFVVERVGPVFGSKVETPKA